MPHIIIENMIMHTPDGHVQIIGQLLLQPLLPERFFITYFENFFPLPSVQYL